jgi:tRNA(Ile2) C34 agmatinyltransferase TiaS
MIVFTNMPEKEGKLHNIKETASDAVAIMRELGTPGVQESFEVIREIAEIAKEIMETMKTPEWQQNMENIRIISENINSVSTRMDKTTAGLKETGVIEDAKGLINAVRSKMDSFGLAGGGQQSAAAGGGAAKTGISGQDLKDLSTSFKEMLEAVKALAWELRVTVSESKKSGTMRNIEETFREASDTYRTVKREVEEGAEK